MVPINVIFWMSEPNDKYRGKFIGMNEIYTTKFWSFMRKVNREMLFKNGRPKVCATNVWAAATIGLICYIVPTTIEDERKFREIAVNNYMRDIAPLQRFWRSLRLFVHPKTSFEILICNTWSNFYVLRCYRMGSLPWIRFALEFQFKLKMSRKDLLFIPVSKPLRIIDTVSNQFFKNKTPVKRLCSKI